MSNPDEILQAVKVFNRDAPRFPDLAWDIVRRTRLWVLDQATGMLGPNKFVGFEGMTFDLYEAARNNTVAGVKFDGHVARNAIEKIADEYRGDVALHDPLRKWAVTLVGPRVFDGVDDSKWKFLTLGSPTAGLDFTGWNPWRPLTGAEVDGVPVTPGAYVIRVLAEDRRDAQPLRRCCGDDEHGILDIGESKDINARIGALLRCMSDANESGHMAGWRYAYLGMHRLFPLERIEFRYKGAASKEAAHGLEGEMLAVYVRKHFELPPLNYKMNWSAM